MATTLCPIPASEITVCVWPRTVPDYAWMIPAEERRPRYRGRPKTFKFRFKRGEIEQRVVQAFGGRVATVKEIAARAGLTWREARSAVERMRQRGEIVRASDRRVRSQYHYRLASRDVGAGRAA